MAPMRGLRITKRAAARARGEDVILLSVGDPPIETPTAVVDRGGRAAARRRHSLHAGARPAAIAASHRARACGAHSSGRQRRQRHRARRHAERFCSSRRCAWRGPEMKSSRLIRCIRPTRPPSSLRRAHGARARSRLKMVSARILRSSHRSLRRGPRHFFREPQ